MEIADIYVLNKAELAGADKLEQELRFLLGLAPRGDGWVPPVVRTTATTGAGVSQIVEAVRAFRESGVAAARAQANWAARLQAMYRERVLARLDAGDVRQAAEDVAGRRRDPYAVIEEWLKGETRS